ncbi:hypothetical protein BDK51DRAFT_32540, partial [Blyttiomyces helicus]
MSRFLDSLAQAQRHDVGALCGKNGHLNPANTNREYDTIRGASCMDGIVGNVPVEKAAAAGKAAGRGDRAKAEGFDIENKLAAKRRGKEEHLAALGPPDEDGGHTIATLHDVLERFDSVKLREVHPPPPSPPADSSRPNESGAADADVGTAAGLPEVDPSRRRQFVPPYLLNVTKIDQYKSLRAIDSGLVERDWNYMQNSYAQIGKLASLEEFLAKELSALDFQNNGPDPRRLQVYKFKVYGPILADIKVQRNDMELEFLRTKVQKLLSQNENRLLLKYERKRSKELERQLDILRVENETLKKDLRRKLAIYAQYLPPSALVEKKKEDPLIASLVDEIRSYSIGEDPISLYERKIDSLQKEVEARDEDMEQMKRKQEEEYVPRIAQERLEETLKDAEAKLRKMKEKNESLEKEKEAGELEYRKIEETLREKEEQYKFLILEYNELSEAVAVSFDNKVLKK